MTNPGMQPERRRVGHATDLGADAMRDVMRAALQARVSDDRFKTGDSVDEQERDERKVCDAKGWDPVHVYREPPQSASRFATKVRKIWLRLIKDLDAGLYDVVVLWEVSRGSRKLDDAIRFLDVCRARGVLIHICKDRRTFDPGEVSSDYHDLVRKFTAASEQSDETSDRILRHVAYQAERGRPHGVCPYGYIRRYDPVTRALVAQEVDDVARVIVDEDGTTRTTTPTAPIVREIITRVANGVPLLVLAADLNARGVPVPSTRHPKKGADNDEAAEPKRWRNATIRAIVTRRAYLGERDHRGTLHAAAWPPLFDDDPTVWYAANRVLADPRRRKTHPDARRPGRCKYLLTASAVCGTCGDKLTSAHSPRSRVPAWPGPRYTCPDSAHASAFMHDVDPLVEEAVVRRLAMDDAYDTIARSDDKAAHDARAHIEKLKSDLKMWRESAREGRTTPESLYEIESGLLADIAQAERTERDAAVPMQLRGLLDRADVGDKRARIDVVRQRWVALDIASKRDVVEVLFDEIALLPQRAIRNGRTEFDPSRLRMTWRV